MEGIKNDLILKLKDKRYKLEDDVFYYKEKVREFQTQHKWREAKKKPDQQAKFQLPGLNNEQSLEDPSRELRDVFEREADLRDQLRFTEGMLI